MQTQIISRIGSYEWKGRIGSILTTSPFMTGLFLKNLSDLCRYDQPFLVQTPHNFPSVRLFGIYLAAKITPKTIYINKPARGRFLFAPVHDF